MTDLIVLCSDEPKRYSCRLVVLYTDHCTQYTHLKLETGWTPVRSFCKVASAMWGMRGVRSEQTMLQMRASSTTTLNRVSSDSEIRKSEGGRRSSAGAEPPGMRKQGVHRSERQEGMEEEAPSRLH